MKYLIKLDRISAWTLLVSIILYFISGFGMTKGLINPSFANKIHLSLLAPIALAAFTIHTYFAIHLAFKRWHIWNNFSKILLFSFYLAFFAGFIYVDQFYHKPVNQEANTTVNNTQTETPASTSNINQTTDQTQQQNSGVSKTRIFTASELAKYNGENGQPAYVAVDGKIYDLTSVFRNGTHHGFTAGQDQSAAFHYQHYDSILNRYTIVGTLSN